ncbi:hypothetical protein NZNM25_17600 [Nitrosopumilus zosterae]|uniref:Uncharacterized protein n=1 Tax=Nitrosopumilus zosterae TaxID=718286 RepID=A0A2S2KTL5_9ARCH|nr:hypothetical protein NZNM25_17600 [Nitrosopumilus zosterae]
MVVLQVLGQFYKIKTILLTILVSITKHYEFFYLLYVETISAMNPIPLTIAVPYKAPFFLSFL